MRCDLLSKYLACNCLCIGEMHKNAQSVFCTLVVYNFSLVLKGNMGRGYIVDDAVKEYLSQICDQHTRPVTGLLIGQVWIHGIFFLSHITIN